MAKKQLITKVWIEEGCIVCDACETAAPEVFEVMDDTCVIRPDALNAEFTKPRSEGIVDAAEECPVDVIKFDSDTVEVADEAPTEPAAAPATETQTAPSPAKKAPAAEPKKAAPQKAPASVGKTKAPSAGEPDPSIQALLEAATSRGGNAGIMRNSTEVPTSAQGWRATDVDNLPPDARQAKVVEAAQKAKKQSALHRRDFVSNSAVAIGWTAFGVGTGISIGPAFGRFMMPNVLEEPDPRIRVGKITRYMEMAPGDVNEDYKPQGIWMIRDEDRIAALNIICTHLGCIPNWQPNDRKFKCPCHGSGYYSDGINFEGPTPRPLERFKITIKDGIVIVDKSKKYQYELGQWDQPGSYILV